MVAHPLPTISDEDRKLLRDTRTKYPNLKLSDLSVARLGQIRRLEGLDFATAVAFDAAWREPRHRRCIAGVESYLRHENPKIDVEDAVFCLVPNLGYSEDPKAQVTGEAVLQAAERLGFAVVLAPTSHAVDLVGNAQIVAKTVSELPQRHVVLASMSVGGAYVKVAISEVPNESLWQRVKTWINICGLLDGTIVGSMLADRLTNELETQIHQWLTTRGADFSRHTIRALCECGRGPGSKLDCSLALPDGLFMLNVVACPLQRHIAYEHTKELHRITGESGPNDGLGLLADMLDKPGDVFPIWGSDHYIDLHIDVERVVDALVRYAWMRSDHST